MTKTKIFVTPQVAYPRRLHGIKFTRIQEIEYLTLGHPSVLIKILEAMLKIFVSTLQS
jgi:hypothetical protein